MSKRKYLIGTLLLLGTLIGAGTPDAGAKVKQGILEVSLTNPGDSVGQIVFFVQAPDIGLGKVRESITVRSPKGQNLFNPSTNMAGGPVQVEQAFGDVVKVTLTPLRVFRPNENVTFVFTVSDVNSARILSGEINNNGVKAGAPPAWYNNDGKGPAGTTGTQLVPGPKLPGFNVVVRDAGYTIFNDFDLPLGIQNLRFFPNITESVFDAFDLDTVVTETLDSSLLNFSLSPLTFAEFLNLPDPEPDNLFIGVGQMLDSSGRVIGAFAEGVQILIVPEPSSLTLLLTVLAGMLAVGWPRAGIGPQRCGLFGLPTSGRPAS